MSRLSSTLANLFVSLPLAAALLGAATHAQAQNAQGQSGTTATIPFAFSANNQHVSAGSYKVQLLSDRFMCLRNIKTARTQCLMVRPESGRVIETQGRLIFHRDGRRSYLTQVWIPGTNIHSELVTRPRPEAMLAKGTPSAGSSIEVAMK